MWRVYRVCVGRRRPSRSYVAAAAIFMSIGPLSACSDEPSVTEVDAGSAIVAIVDWQVEQWDPPADADEGLLPVIYIVAADGDTYGVAVQATVTEATVDDAVVRFADQASDAFDDGLDGAPVRDDGVMLAIGQIPEPSRRMKVIVDRYTAKETSEGFALQIAARRPTDDNPRRAEVTTTTPR